MEDIFIHDIIEKEPEKGKVVKKSGPNSKVEPNTKKVEK